MCFGGGSSYSPPPNATKPAPLDTPTPAGDASRQAFIQTRAPGTIIDTNTARGTSVLGEVGS